MTREELEQLRAELSAGLQQTAALREQIEAQYHETVGQLKMINAMLQKLDAAESGDEATE